MEKNINNLYKLQMKKVFIKNRKNLKIAVLVDKTKNQKGLVFVMHGLSGCKEHEPIVTIAKSFKDKNFTVIRFDTTNTYGESDGNYENATLTNYYKDLEDVINWAKTQKFYKEPFVLSGHSFGGICTLLYAEKYPKKVLAIAPISTVIYGKLSVKANKERDAKRFANWKKTGWLETKSESKPGLIKRLPWSHMQDRLKYDVLKKVHKLTMPVLLIVGENDISTPKEQIQMLFDKLPEKRELHIIKNAPHTFRDKKHLQEIKKLFLHWINSLNKTI